MKIDLKNIRELAEKADDWSECVGYTAEYPIFRDRTKPKESYPFQIDYSIKNVEFITTANPKTMFEILEYVEKLEAVRKAAKNIMDARGVTTDLVSDRINLRELREALAALEDGE